MRVEQKCEKNVGCDEAEGCVSVIGALQERAAADKERINNLGGNKPHRRAAVYAIGGLKPQVIAVHHNIMALWGEEFEDAKRLAAAPAALLVLVPFRPIRWPTNELSGHGTHYSLHFAYFLLWRTVGACR